MNNRKMSKLKSSFIKEIEEITKEESIKVENINELFKKKEIMNYEY